MAAFGQDAAKIVQPSPASATADAAPARIDNRDVLKMLEARLAPEVVVAKIKTSAADFDTSPEALKALRDAGAPDSVILAVVEAPRVPAVAAPAGESKKVVAVKVPAGTRVEVESAYRVNSQEVRVGDLITFRVVNPVKVGGVTVVEPGAVATARVVKASRGGHWGRAGRLAWEMYEVTAADGSRLQIQFAGRQVGDSKGAKVATQIALTAALLPLVAPVALLHGFKRGENAYLPEGKRFDVSVRAEATVSGAASGPED
ncbi:MAG TPA: hypothetical protein VF240_09580 [Pyrinomonadaceae bacterium]